MKNIPYDWTRDFQNGSPINMDDRHVRQLYRVCERVRPAHVVEVGSYYGASTSAFIEAMNDGLVERLTIYELKVRPELERTLAMAKDPKRITVHQCPFWECPVPAELVFIDGDHEMGALGDLAAALAMNATHIMLHDSNAHACGLGCWGVHWAKNLLIASGSLCFHDNAKRRVEWTHRGLFYALTDPINADCGWEMGDCA